MAQQRMLTFVSVDQQTPEKREPDERRADFHEVDALFRYHLTCGGCGGRLLALNQSVRGIRYPRYKCQGRHCTQRAAYVIEAVDAAVWGVLIDGLCRPGGLAVSATAQPAATGNPTERIAEAVARRKAQQAEIDDLVTSFTSAHAAVRLSVSAWDRVIAEQESLRDQHEEFAQRAALAEHRLSAVRRSLGQELTFSQRRRIVDILFANGGGRVLVHPAEGRRARLEVVCDLLAPRPALADDNLDTPPGGQDLRVVPANSRRCKHACTPDKGSATSRTRCPASRWAAGWSSRPHRAARALRAAAARPNRQRPRGSG